MQDRKIRIPDDRTLISQLHAMRKIVTATSIRYSHPDSGKVQHDDYVWALALAVFDMPIPGEIGVSDFNPFQEEPEEIDGYSEAGSY
jgi:hypothetical protein